MALVKAIYVCLLFYSAAIGESQSSKEDLNSEKRVLSNQDVQAKANAQLLVDSVRRATNTGSKQMFFTSIGKPRRFTSNFRYSYSADSWPWLKETE